MNVPEKSVPYPPGNRSNGEMIEAKLYRPAILIKRMKGSQTGG
jgi:hypothetical protein